MKIEQALLNQIGENFKFVKKDPYLLQNHERIYDLFYETAQQLEKTQLPELKLKEYWEKEKVLEIVKQFLSSLSPEYAESFSQDLKRTIPRIIQTNSPSRYRKYYNFYLITYSKTHTLYDLLALAHEYMHHLSTKHPKKKTISPALETYAEVISLLGELKLLKFLKENNISTETELYKQLHIKKEYENGFTSFLITEPLLNCYLQKERLEEQHIQMLQKENPMYYNLDEKTLLTYLNYLTSKKLCKRSLSYQHQIGMILSSTLHQSAISNEEFVSLTETINTVGITEFHNQLPQKTNLELAQDTKKEFTYQKRK